MSLWNFINVFVLNNFLKIPASTLDLDLEPAPGQEAEYV